MERPKKQQKIALITPPLIEGAYYHPIFPPLGLAYLAAVLEQNNFEVQIIDCPASKIGYEKLKAELSSMEPALIGIASMTATIPSALKAARVAKEACPYSKVVMGGPHATFADTQILTEEPAVDVIVRGEGEETLLELAQNLPNLKNLNRIKGITFRNRNQIIQTPQRSFIQNLDELPLPSYRSLPIESYRICGKKLLPIMTSRGCPFQCSFCVASQMFGAKFRARSPKNVVDEIEWLINTYGAEGISFHDDTLTLDKKRIFDICDEIINRKIKIAWGCQTRVDQVSKEIFAKMRKAGCNEVSFGVESGCQKILDAVKKKVSIEQSINAVKWAKEEDLFVAVSTIIGYPGETKETLKQTLDLIHKLEPDDVWLCLATPYPGTELRALVERMGWKMATDWTLYTTMNPIFENPDLPSEEISKMRTQFYDKFYSPQYVFRQMIKGYVKGNLYSKIMARTAANYLLWRIKSHM
ncbi:MAG: radical SAM protein [Candidatus Bathyarchaeia archaeon]